MIADILSRLESVQDVVIASASCRNWREAFCRNLHTLSFSSSDWPTTTSCLQKLRTHTTELESLSILIDEVDELSASAAITWLVRTRETLRTLFYSVRTTPNVNILEIYGWRKLEMLELSHNSIMGVDLNFQFYPCLRSLSLSLIRVSAPGLSHLLTTCPVIEKLKLINPEIATNDARMIVELNSPTLKDIYLEAIGLQKLTLRADGIERLHLKDCIIDELELTGKGTLKHFQIDGASIIYLDIGDTTYNLDTIDVSSFTTVWSKLYQLVMNMNSLKVQRLRLWDLDLDGKDGIVDLETIAVCFPRLRHLCLGYGLGGGALEYCL